MRFEKINDKQIRCTLNKKDLSDRELRISELAYGTEKAKALFRDMMQQASYELGFETENIPLMIEAIPIGPDTLILVITKVEDPDELDTRFSHFSEEENEDLDEYDNIFAYAGSDNEDDSFEPELLNEYEFSDNEDSDTISILPTKNDPASDFISLSEALGMEPRPKTSEQTVNTDIIKLFRFDSLQDLSALAENITTIYHGKNMIYKDTVHNHYYLVIHRSEHSPENFNHICNIISEYGTLLKNMYASHSYFEEHYEVLLANDALQTLASI